MAGAGGGLEEYAADHAEREQREGLEEAVGGVGEEGGFGGAEAEEGEVADAHGEAHDGDVPGQGVDGVALDGLAAGVGAGVGEVDAASLVEGALVEGADFLDDALAVGPVHERHAPDDADDHADGRDGEA